MARPKNSTAPDLRQAVKLTEGVIDRLVCPPDKEQGFLRDLEVPSLRVRVTAAGAKSFVFESKLNRQTIRRTIGDVKTWSIADARVEARKLKVNIDGGNDPRELDRQREAERKARADERAAKELTVQDAWDTYLMVRRPHWSDRHYADHIEKAKPGGGIAIRGTRGRGVTVAGPLHVFMGMRLSDLTRDVVADWAQEQAKTRPTAARLSWRLLRGFLNWAAEQKAYKPVLPDHNAAQSKAARQALGKASAKHDALQREQLPAWFGAVRQLPNASVAAYLQSVLLTGARPGEVLSLRWQDINFQWKGLTIHDKVEGTREIPLTPYVEHLLSALPRVNSWVFASPSRDPARINSPISKPHKPHESACAVAGIEGLTLHGLRRSFKSLSEWLELPAGVVAQLMGHKPSATAEKHYTNRPLDLLRIHHTKFEAWVLEQAGIAFEATTEPGKLRVVSNNTAKP